MNCQRNVNSILPTELPHTFSYIVAIFIYNHFESRNRPARNKSPYHYSENKPFSLSSKTESVAKRLLLTIVTNVLRESALKTLFHSQLAQNSLTNTSKIGK
jgi:hypothetical protein